MEFIFKIAYKYIKSAQIALECKALFLPSSVYFGCGSLSKLSDYWHTDNDKRWDYNSIMEILYLILFASVSFALAYTASPY